MTKVRKKFDKGIRLDPSSIPGSIEGDFWVDSSDNKPKIFLDGQAREFNTTTATSAAQITYDNSTSGLQATNLQDAIDELKLMVDSINLPSVKTSLHVEQQPTTTLPNVNINPAITVQLKDQLGENVSGTNPITATLYQNGSPASSAVLSGTTTVNASGGLAIFADLQVDTNGIYKIVFSSPGFVDGTTLQFNVESEDRKSVV